MSTIWKFPLTEAARQVVMMPHGARILDAQLNEGWITLWAQFHSNIEPPHCSPRVIYIIGTGREFPLGAKEYIATIQHGSFVWHVYEGV